MAYPLSEEDYRRKMSNSLHSSSGRKYSSLTSGQDFPFTGSSTVVWEKVFKHVKVEEPLKGIKKAKSPHRKPISFLRILRRAELSALLLPFLLFAVTVTGGVLGVELAARSARQSIMDRCG